MIQNIKPKFLWRSSSITIFFKKCLKKFKPTLYLRNFKPHTRLFIDFIKLIIKLNNKVRFINKLLERTIFF